MIVRTLDEITSTDRDVSGETWRSKRLLLAGDEMGFSFHETRIFAGTETRMHYQHHLEAVFCVEGEGEIETLDVATGVPDGRRWAIRPGTVYALDRHDRHVLRARTELRLLCVFNPPVTGRETHDASGAYPPSPAASPPRSPSPEPAAE
ncbi:MAG: ectoine synthase [Myxococcota bacterium]|nr:ectoine synthase [Myxococcota bacterium]